MKRVLLAFALLLLTGCASTHLVRTASPVNEATPSTLVRHLPAVMPAPLQVPHPQIAFVIDHPPPAAKSFDLAVMLNPAEVECMAKAIYFEARGEGSRGMAAAGYVVANRVNSQRFPPSVCKVVYQGKHIQGRVVRNRCEFAWYCDGLSDAPKNAKMYAVAQDMARKVLLGQVANPVGGSLYFHALTAKHRKRSAYAEHYRIGRQVFFSYVSSLQRHPRAESASVLPHDT